MWCVLGHVLTTNMTKITKVGTVRKCSYSKNKFSLHVLRVHHGPVILVANCVVGGTKIECPSSSDCQPHFQHNAITPSHHLCQISIITPPSSRTSRAPFPSLINGAYHLFIYLFIIRFVKNRVTPKGLGLYKGASQVTKTDLLYN